MTVWYLRAFVFVGVVALVLGAVVLSGCTGLRCAVAGSINYECPNASAPFNSGR